MPFSQPYLVVYDEAILPALTECGFTAQRADQNPSSTVIIEDIRAAIALADLVVVEASEPNKNVYFELGISSALKKETILLTTDAGALPFDTRHIRHLVYASNEMGAFKVEILRWLHSTAAFAATQRRTLPRTLNRGDLLPDICDATFLSNRMPIDPRPELMSAIRSGRLINPKHIYSFERGTRLWLDMCADHDYEYFRASLKLLRDNTSQILDHIDAKVLSSGPDVISLGPGNGRKDRVLLKALLQRLDNSTGDFYYYPVDINVAMLATAVREIRREELITRSVKVKAAIADYEQDLRALAPMYQFRSAPNIFLFLGNSLGNFENETDMLLQLQHAMLPGDFALIEVATANSKEIDLGGSDEINRQFDFTPLDALGVRYERPRLEYVFAHDRSHIPHTRTIIATYDSPVIPNVEEEFGLVQLSYIHEYSQGELVGVVKRLGFDVRLSLVGQGSMYMLLQKPGASA
jgi:hypothetical protein